MTNNLTTLVSSKSQNVEINRANPTVIVGERINPTGRKLMLKALQEGNFDAVLIQHVVSPVPAPAENDDNQQEHHRFSSFEEEFLLLLKRHQTEYDERYVFG